MEKPCMESINNKEKGRRRVGGSIKISIKMYKTERKRKRQKKNNLLDKEKKKKKQPKLWKKKKKQPKIWKKRKKFSSCQA